MAKLKDFVVKLRPAVDKTALAKTAKEIGTAISGAVGRTTAATQRGIAAASHALNIVKMITGEIRKTEEAVKAIGADMQSATDKADALGTSLGAYAITAETAGRAGINMADLENLAAKVGQARMGGNSNVAFNTDDDLANLIALLSSGASLDELVQTGIFGARDLNVLRRVMGGMGGNFIGDLQSRLSDKEAIDAASTQQRAVAARHSGAMADIMAASWQSIINSGAYGAALDAETARARNQLNQLNMNGPRIAGDIMTANEAYMMINNMINTVLATGINTLIDIYTEVQGGGNLIGALLNKAILPAGRTLLNEAGPMVVQWIKEGAAGLADSIGQKISSLMPWNWGKNSNKEYD
jgi:hypothetical protein